MIVVMVMFGLLLITWVNSLQNPVDNFRLQNNPFILQFLLPAFSKYHPFFVMLEVLFFTLCSYSDCKERSTNIQK